MHGITSIEWFIYDVMMCLCPLHLIEPIKMTNCVQVQSNERKRNTESSSSHNQFRQTPESQVILVLPNFKIFVQNWLKTDEGVTLSHFPSMTCCLILEAVGSSRMQPDSQANCSTVRLNRGRFAQSLICYFNIFLVLSTQAATKGVERTNGWRIWGFQGRFTFILGVFLHIHLGELEPGNPFNYTHDCNIL